MKILRDSQHFYGCCCWLWRSVDFAKPFVYPNVLRTRISFGEILGLRLMRGVIGGWCPASRNRVRLCWLCTLLTWARNRGICSGLGETALTPDAVLLSWGAEHQNTGQTVFGRCGIRLRWGGLEWRTHVSNRFLETTLVWQCPHFKTFPPNLHLFKKQMKNLLFSFVCVYSITFWKQEKLVLTAIFSIHQDVASSFACYHSNDYALRFVRHTLWGQARRRKTWLQHLLTEGPSKNATYLSRSFST